MTLGDEKKSGFGDLIIYTWYCYLALFSYINNWLFGVFPKYFYDVFVFVIGLSCLVLMLVKLRCNTRYPGLLLKYLIIPFFIVFMVKQGNVFDLVEWDKPQYIFAFLREIKPIFYAVVFSMFLLSYRPPRIEVFLTGGIFLAILIIFDFLYKFAIYGEISRPYVVDESNYDNFLILLSLLALFISGHRRFYPILFLFAVATLCSQSKTGIGVFLIMLSIYTVYGTKHTISRLVLFFAVLLAIPVIYLVIEHRLDNLDSLESLDRFRMWSVFLEYMRNASIEQLLFGQLTGASLVDYDMRLAWFITNQSEAIGAEGIHPFNFHGFHPRFISSWGILLYLLYWYVVYKFVKNREGGIYVLLLMFLEGISLGVSYLSTVSFALWLFLYSLRESKVK